MLIVNYTPDPITWQYGGETGTIKPDQEIEIRIFPCSSLAERINTLTGI